jgi:hypothetical protein
MMDLARTSYKFEERVERERAQREKYEQAMAEKRSGLNPPAGRARTHPQAHSRRMAQLPAYMLGAGGYAKKTNVAQPERGGDRKDTYLRREEK